MRHDDTPTSSTIHAQDPPQATAERITADSWASFMDEGASLAHEGVAQVPLTGPPSPQRTVPAPSTEQALEMRAHRESALVWWLGAHGGAGESTLAHLLEGSRAADHAWPDLHGQTPSVVLVARTNAYGLERARVAAQQWSASATPIVRLLGLVTVADAPGRLPPPLGDLLRLTRGAVPRTWDLPWSEHLRLGADPTSVRQPRALRRLLSDVSHLASVPEAITHPEGAIHDPLPAARL